MPRRGWTPHEKKRWSLERDTVDASEHPKAVRWNWPRKKARAERAYRHAWNQALHEPDLVDEPAIKRKQVRRWSPVRLADVIRQKKERRLRRPN
jgi:hypothetical protein